MLSFLKGTALDYFKLLLMDPHAKPTWSNDYNELVSELQTNFGPFDIKANAENELEWLKMCDNQKVATLLGIHYFYTDRIHRHGIKTQIHL